MIRQLFVFVPGQPLPQGSKRPVRNKYSGKLSVIDNNPHLKEWRFAVAAYAKAAMGEASFPTIECAVAVDITFVMPRPRGHYGMGRNAERLLPSAPDYHTKAPDLDKLQRAILDGFTDAGVWLDDSQVVKITAWKRYGTWGEPTGAAVRVTTAQ